MLVILIDGQFQHIAPRQRIRALMELANFMAIDGVSPWIIINLYTRGLRKVIFYKNT